MFPCTRPFPPQYLTRLFNPCLFRLAYMSRMSCMSPQFVYQLQLDYCCHYLSAHDLSLPPRRASASGNCLTLVTLLFDFAHYRKPSRLIHRLYDFLTARRTRIYLPLSEIPGPQQKASAVHELKPLSIPPVTSGNLRDPVFAPGSLGLTHNNQAGPSGSI